MTNDITRRDALALGVSAAALAATGASAQTASNIKAADVAAPKLPIEKGASLRMLRPVRFVKADEDVFRANAAKFTEKTGRRGQGRFRRLGRHQPADRGDLELRRRPRHHHRLLGRAAHLCRQADRTHRRRRLSRQALWRLAESGAEIRQAQQERRLDRIAVRRQRRPADLSQIDSAIGRLRQGAGRSRRVPRALQEAAEGRQARRLCARQRRRRRQRLCGLAVVVAQRLAAG